MYTNQDGQTDAVKRIQTTAEFSFSPSKVANDGANSFNFGFNAQSNFPLNVPVRAINQYAKKYKYELDRQLKLKESAIRDIKISFSHQIEDLESRLSNACSQMITLKENNRNLIEEYSAYVKNTELVIQAHKR